MRVFAETKVSDFERNLWRESVRRDEKDFIRHDLTYKIAEELFKKEGLLTHEDFKEEINGFCTKYKIDFFILRPSTLMDILECLQNKYNIHPEDIDITLDKMYERL
jgi:hypothetical protein